jgi:hypothetical protein
MYKKLAYNCDKQQLPQIIGDYLNIAQYKINETNFENAHVTIQKYQKYKNS